MICHWRYGNNADEGILVAVCECLLLLFRERRLVTYLKNFLQRLHPRLMLNKVWHRDSADEGVLDVVCECLPDPTITAVQTMAVTYLKNFLQCLHHRLTSLKPLTSVNKLHDIKTSYFISVSECFTWNKPHLSKLSSIHWSLVAAWVPVKCMFSTTNVSSQTAREQICLLRCCTVTAATHGWPSMCYIRKHHKRRSVWVKTFTTVLQAKFAKHQIVQKTLSNRRFVKARDHMWPITPKQVIGSHMVMCITQWLLLAYAYRTNSIWLIQTAHRTNSNGLK